jgi:hypothetical protein
LGFWILKKFLRVHTKSPTTNLIKNADNTENKNIPAKVNNAFLFFTANY